MAERKKQQNVGHQGFYIAFTLMLILLGIWAFAPEKMFEGTWKIEQHEILDAGGAGTNEWVLAQSMHLTAALNEYATNMAGGIAKDSTPMIAAWTIDRAEASIIWINLIAYRAFILIMWFLIGIPFVVATAVDAFYAREIAKETFVAQSPNRHKLGVGVFHWTHIVLTVWIMLPFHLPYLVIPSFTVLNAASIWIWIRNLQKRL